MLCARSLGRVSALVKAFAGGQRTMCSRGTDTDYHVVVKTLNGLQTNAAVLEEASKSGTARQRRSRELSCVVDFLKRIGLKTSDLDRLNAIHITGTKGKGSVCAISERILRTYGLKTGFYSSPHLREVRERIRVNGRPLPKDQFVENFWEVYNKLSHTKEDHGGVMPPYFRFLTVMAFSVFLKEKVDVAVIEVGIGGTFDSTNVIPNPVVCGIASLGLDHVELLGDTLEKIAWQKGGICKPGHPVFTLPQEPGPLAVLQERARELGALPLKVAPELEDYPGEEPALGLAGDFQKSNASLAIQLCHSWLKSRGKWSHSHEDTKKRILHGVPVAPTFPLPPEFYQGIVFSTGLREVSWPGRNQIIKRESLTYYLDGAHTPKSIEASADWFLKAADKEAETLRGSIVRALIFNITGKRTLRTDVFMRPLVSCGFDYALFVPNVSGVSGDCSADQTNLTVTQDQVLERVRNNERTWQTLIREKSDPFIRTHHADSNTENSSTVSNASEPQTRVFPDLKKAVDWLSDHSVEQSLPYAHKLRAASHIQVLVSGSLHLAGAFMSALDVNVD